MSNDPVIEPAAPDSAENVSYRSSYRNPGNYQYRSRPWFCFLMAIAWMVAGVYAPDRMIAADRGSGNEQESANAKSKSASVLADAIQSRKNSIVETLLSGDADVNAKQADGMTALHWAVYHGKHDWVTKLIAAGAEVENANRYEVRPLSIACQTGNAKVVSLLLDAGADANTKLPGKETVLHTAARTGDVDSVRLLVSAGAKVNAQDRRSQTPLMWAAAAGNNAVVAELLKSGAESDKQLNSGFTAFFFAVREGRSAVVETFLANGQDVNQAMQSKKSGGNQPKSGTSPLLLAVENGHLELALKLIEHGADVNDSRLGYTALHALTWVRKPIRGDGDPPPRISGSVSTLNFAEALLIQGADVDARHGKVSAGNLRLNRTDATPLLLAAETGDLALVQLLVRHGANPLAKTAANCTPLLAAAGVGVIGDGDETAGTEEEAIATIRYLLDLGADLNAVDDDGKTALHGAAFKSWTKLIDFLIEQGADPDVWNQKMKRGWTPLDIAKGNRPGNFRPSAPTIAAVERAMEKCGLELPQN